MRQHNHKPERYYRIRTETRTARKSGYSREVTTETLSAFPGDEVVYGGAAALEKVQEAFAPVEKAPNMMGDDERRRRT